LGRKGEEVAAAFLEEKGWTIAARNVRIGHRELDLVAIRENVLAFVEVKTRSGGDFGDPLEAITPRKMQDIAVAAAGWIRGRGRGGRWKIRFDAVGILWRPGRPPEVVYLPDAWRMG
jgi:putative endonuclease